MKIAIDKNQIRQFCKQNNLSYFGIFGSYARGEETNSSDIDVLIDYDKPKSLLDLGGIVSDLEMMLGKEIDLVNRKKIKPILKPYIDKDILTIYEQN